MSKTISSLNDNASNEEIISKINEMINILNTLTIDNIERQIKKRLNEQINICAEGLYI